MPDARCAKEAAAHKLKINARLKKRRVIPLNSYIDLSTLLDLRAQLEKKRALVDKWKKQRESVRARATEFI